MSKLALLLWVMPLVLIHTVGSSNLHYITPLPTTQCPGEPCLTLSTLATDSSYYFDSNATVIFLEGNHTLDSELFVSTISGSLTLFSNGSDSVAIICTGNTTVVFADITQLQISGLEFISCSIEAKFVKHFTLKDSWFCNGKDGSALHLSHTNTSIVWSSFTSNTAGTYQNHIGVLDFLNNNSHNFYHPQPVITSNSARVGGALTIISSTVTISGSHFKNNNAEVGGAIFSQLGSNIRIRNCTFVNNSATGCSDDGCLGGALFIDSGCTVTAHNSTFMNNTAGYSGGAIALFHGTLLNCAHNVFSSNRAGRSGGAISAYNRSSISINNSYYCYNMGEDGGAIYLYRYSNITVGNSSFCNNEADNFGGVLNAQDSSSIAVGSSSFIDSKAGDYAGVMVAYSSSYITVDNSSFDKNEAGYDGGVMGAYYSSSISVRDCSFDTNTAGNDGGVAVAFFNSNITFSSSSFINIRAAYDGGVMYAQDSSSIVVGNSLFDSNTAGNVGGVAVAVSTSSISVNDSFFENNKAGYGGALYAWKTSCIVVDNGSFVSNKAGNNGGVMIAHINSNITVGNSSFNKNKASYNGGVMGAYSNSCINVGNTSFNKNTASNNGGVISAYSSSNITIGNSSFDDNVAIDDGGVIYARGSSSITIGNCSFGNNTANDNGGVMGTYSNSSIIVGNCIFYNNTAGRSGAVMAAYFNGNVLVSNCSFDRNVAGYDGGVVLADLSSSVTVGNCSFDRNVAGYDGGVVLADSSSSITVGNSSFNNNVANDDGGVMCAYSKSSITVINGFFGNNKAGDVGGVLLAWNASSVTMDNSYFNNNEAGRSGGVLYVEESSSIIVENSSFVNNEAGYDGVMSAWNSSSITVNHSSFDSSEAGNDCGVMYAGKSSSITVDNSSLNNSKANYNGGVMCAYFSSSIYVGHSSFNSSEAGNGGGVLYAEHSSITVDSSSFDNNKVGSDGGVIYASPNDSITVDGSSFDNNKAGGDGGVIYTSFSSSISVNDSSFDDNKAGSNGGVIYASFSGSISVNDSSFDDNKAGSDGGVIYSFFSSSIIVSCSSFNNNEAGGDGGVMDLRHGNTIIVDNCSFDSNEATDNGGAIYAYLSTRIVEKNCTFCNNSAVEGGVIYVHYGIFEDLGNMYIANVANDGGVMILDAGSVYSTSSSFVNNTAVAIGGVLYASNYACKHQITFTGSRFYSNHATRGGAITLLAGDILTVTETFFTYNSAVSGGSIYLQTTNNMTIKNSNFSHNSASSDGGVIYSADQNQLTINNSAFNFNRADNDGGIAYSLFHTELIITGDSSKFIGNQGHRGGVVYARESSINIQCRVLLMANNAAINDGGALHLSNANVTFSSKHNTIVKNAAAYGGAIFADETQLVFSNGTCKLVDNQAQYGGAIYASESKLVVQMNSWTNVSFNLALYHGGGLYMTMSELYVEGRSLSISNNEAKGKGGGIHADSSSIIIGREINGVRNKAENGGAISLERNAKLDGKLSASVNLISNSASHHGGAIYVDDESNPEMCASIIAQHKALSSKTECFSKSVFISFSNNFAGISGANVFGGLLDRCTMPTESYKEVETSTPGLASFQKSSNINESLLHTINSHPVRLCFCRDGQPDCDYQPEPIQINRGRAISLQLIAYNHVSKPVRAVVDISSSGGGIVGSYINEACTETVILQQFNLLAPVDTENLTLSVMGPCNVNGISTRNVLVKFTCTCPIGFQIISNNETFCDCVCHQVLQVYKKTECNLTLESIIRRENFWISYINPTWSNSSINGYILHPHCPFHYCYTPDEQISINLNLPNGSDAQCAHNRMGTLCGTCKPGLSMSLGSSNCVPCPTFWPSLLVTIIIVFVISGIGLVALLLTLNLTVAIGTLNAIIFYANIVAANTSALFPSAVSPASVFISWLNFDLGFDVCFFDGLDTYVKTWLQLAFPAYIIILVVVIIQLSYYFNAFGHFVGKKDPVATLATLILLSYTKLLQIIITVFSSATLVYPDGSKKTLWLPDASIQYFTSKHAVLFFTAIIILILGFMYTLVLSSWQWFLCFPRKRVKWIQSQKFSSFMEIYLVPYTPTHRYWTGLLLLIRVTLYLVSAFNPSGDPRVALSATTFIMTSLLLYIATFSVRVYKNRFINIMEMLTYFNVIALFIFSWNTIDADTNQTIITNISVSITFIQLTSVIVYHMYKHTNKKLFTTIQGSVICMKIKQLASKMHKRHSKTDIDQVHEILDYIDRPPVTTNDHSAFLTWPKSAELTISVIELPKHVLDPATPPPPEAIEEARTGAGVN